MQQPKPEDAAKEKMSSLSSEQGGTCMEGSSQEPARKAEKPPEYTGHESGS